MSYLVATTRPLPLTNFHCSNLAGALIYGPVRGHITSLGATLPQALANQLY